ncbi:MAG: peroxiredoxin reductase [Candidatus Midichloriaceae bacterium]|jgi:hypothetical protein|nr:peroxiredoxin reductase [Candidatus Midichloriaceae bacterium]
MSLSSIYKKIPPYLPDLADNFKAMFIDFKPEVITEEQFISVSLAICYVLKNEFLLNNFKAEAILCLDASSISCIKSGVVMLARDSVFYKFTSASCNEQIKSSKIALNEETIANMNTDHITLYMCLLAASILDNCTRNMEAYTSMLLARGISEDVMLLIAKMAAVLKAVSESYGIEAIRNYEFTPRGENI